MTQHTILPATRDQLPFLEEAIRSTWEDLRARQPHAFAKGDLETSVILALHAAFEDENGAPVYGSQRIFVLLSDDTLAGVITLSTPRHRPDHQPPFINIDDIYVAPAFRRQGLGTALVEHIMAMAGAGDWDNLTATVWAGTEASAAVFVKTDFATTATNLR